MKPSLLAGLAAEAAIPALGLSLRYRRDMNAARACLGAYDPVGFQTWCLVLQVLS